MCLLILKAMFTKLIDDDANAMVANGIDHGQFWLV